MAPWFEISIYAWIGVAVITFFTLLRVTAPYGRHTTNTWGPMISNKLSWMIMESPSGLLVLSLVLLGDVPLHWPTTIFAGLFVMHYFNRSVIFPPRTRTAGKKVPLVITFSAIFFNLVNGSMIGYYLGFVHEYDNSWLQSPQMIGGLLVFLLGVYINVQSDNILLNLRKPGETGYKVPQGGMFSYISCPNHFGEMIEWIGFAIMTWSLPGLAFAIWTIANLLPRALDHHKFYHQKFSSYPAERKAVIPFML